MDIIDVTYTSAIYSVSLLPFESTIPSQRGTLRFIGCIGSVEGGRAYVGTW